MAMAQQSPTFRRTAITYGAGLAGGAILLRWLEYQFALQLFSTELYIVCLSVLFTAIGIWVGRRLSGAAPQQAFSRNNAVVRTLGLTAKELQVLERLAAGGSNLQIAEQLCISQSTVKTHLVHLYQKLEVSRRTQAVSKARSLSIIA